MGTLVVGIIGDKETGGSGVMGVESFDDLGSF